MSGIFTRDRLVYALLFTVASLMFVWPIPRTIAVRYILLAASVTICLWIFIKDKNNPFALPELKPFAYVLFFLTAWFYFVAFFLSTEPNWSIKEINGQWLVALLAFVIGIFSASISGKKIFLSIAFVVAIYFIFLDLKSVRMFVDNGDFPFRIMGLTEGGEKDNYITNFALAILFTEVLFRTLFGKTTLPLDKFQLGFLILLAVLSLIFENTRFGTIGFAIMSITFMTIFFIANGVFKVKKIIPILAGIILLLTAIVYSSITRDDRWSSLKETLSLAIDIEHNKGWIDSEKYQYPKLSDGKIAISSNYERPAWIVAGISFILEKPFGYGYGRTAFGHSIVSKYNEDKKNIGKHSHSGIIDLGIGAGIPGMLGWLFFVAYLSFYGIRQFFNDKSYFGLILCFIAGGYFFRMMFDSIIRDHMLEQFMFLAGLFLALTIQEKNEKNSASKV